MLQSSYCLFSFRSYFSSHQNRSRSRSFSAYRYKYVASPQKRVKFKYVIKIKTFQQQFQTPPWPTSLTGSAASSKVQKAFRVAVGNFTTSIPAKSLACSKGYRSQRTQKPIADSTPNIHRESRPSSQIRFWSSSRFSAQVIWLQGLKNLILGSVNSAWCFWLARTHIRRRNPWHLWTFWSVHNSHGLRRKVAGISRLLFHLLHKDSRCNCCS